MLSSVAGKGSCLTSAHGTRKAAGDRLPHRPWAYNRRRPAHGSCRKPHLRAVLLERLHLELRARHDAAADPALREGAGLLRRRAALTVPGDKTARAPV